MTTQKQKPSCNLWVGYYYADEVDENIFLDHIKVCDTCRENDRIERNYQAHLEIEAQTL